MRKSYLSLLYLLLVSVLALPFSSCSDKEVSDNGEITDPNDPYGKTTDNAISLMAILGGTAEFDSLPDNWNKKSYTLEPTIGRVLDNANPYVRSVACVSEQEAIQFFNSITMGGLSSDATSGTWTKEGIGNLKLQVVKKDGIFATIDVNIQQLPHLNQIRFVDKSLLGENASQKKKPYYQIGDVILVYDNKNELDDTDKRRAWLCVRGCNNEFDKGKSHWVSFNLADENYKYFSPNSKKNLASMNLPTKLCKDPSQEKDILNAVKFFVAISNPEAYDTLKAFKDGLGDFGKVTYSKRIVQNISSRWRVKNLIKYFLPEQTIKDEILSYDNIIAKGNKVNFYYYGYSKNYWSGNMTLYGREIGIDQNGNFYSEEADDTWKPDDKQVNINSYVKGGSRIYGNISNPQGRTKNQALVIRCKTGKELCGEGKINGDDPNNWEAFAGNHIDEVFHYDPSTAVDEDEPYKIGDRAESYDGSIWTCILSPCQGNTKTIFVTTDGIRTRDNGKVILNNDLPTINDIYYLYPWLCSSIFTSDLADLTEQLDDGIFPFSSYMQKQQYLGNAMNSGYRTTFAVKSNSEEHQQLLRMYLDCATRQLNWKYKGFTKYQDTNQNMYLEDASDMSIVRKFYQADTLSNKYWTSGKSGPTYRTKAGHDKVSPYIYSSHVGQFGDPDDYYSVFMEPIAVFRIKVLNPGETPGFARQSPLKYERRNNLEDTIFPWFLTFQISSSKQVIFLNGAPYKVSYSE